jgi:spermidine/putrescine transport system substrate-binding protein
MIQRKWFSALPLMFAVGTAATGVTSVPPVAHAAELHILNWKGWGTDEPWAVEHFEKTQGSKVVQDSMTSFQEAFTKLRTNPGYYDIIDLSTSYTLNAADEGLVQPIDASKLGNFKDLYPDFRDSPQLTREGKVYGVAWIWGGTAVAYDTEVFPSPPTSLDVLWDPKHAGKICWRDDPEDAVRFAAMALGQNPDKPQDLPAIREKLRALKPQIKAFWKSEDEWLKLVAAKQCVLSTIWTTSVEKAHFVYNLPVSFFVPKEGAIAARDALSMVTGAPNPDAAYAFIDYMISPEFYAGWVKAGGAPVAANAAAVEKLPSSSLTKTVLTQPDALKRLNVKGPLSDEQRQANLELWEETKAYFTQ